MTRPLTLLYKTSLTRPPFQQARCCHAATTLRFAPAVAQNLRRWLFGSCPARLPCPPALWDHTTRERFFGSGLHPCPCLHPCPIHHSSHPPFFLNQIPSQLNPLAVNMTVQATHVQTSVTARRGMRRAGGQRRAGPHGEQAEGGWSGQRNQHAGPHLMPARAERTRSSTLALGGAAAAPSLAPPPPLAAGSPALGGRVPLCSGAPLRLRLRLRLRRGLPARRRSLLRLRRRRLGLRLLPRRRCFFRLWLLPPRLLLRLLLLRLLPRRRHLLALRLLLRWRPLLPALPLRCKALLAIVAPAAAGVSAAAGASPAETVDPAALAAEMRSRMRCMWAAAAPPGPAATASGAPAKPRDAAALSLVSLSAKAARCCAITSAGRGGRPAGRAAAGCCWPPSAVAAPLLPNGWALPGGAAAATPSAPPEAVRRMRSCSARPSIVCTSGSPTAAPPADGCTAAASLSSPSKNARRCTAMEASCCCRWRAASSACCCCRCATSSRARLQARGGRQARGAV